jgi:hypothetical protein
VPDDENPEKSTDILKILASTDVNAWRDVAREVTTTGNSPSIAKAILDEAYQRFGHLDVLHDLARLAEWRADWSEATALWRQFIAQRDVFWWAYTSLGACLYRCGNIEEGRATFAEAERRFADQPLVLVELLRALWDSKITNDIAELIQRVLDDFSSLPKQQLLYMGQVALDMDEFSLALRCAERLEPDAGDRGLGNFLTVLKSALSGTDTAALHRFEIVASRFNTTQTSKLLMRFESLGGDYPGCEIGLVQRRLGAEPLGLLRWTTTTPTELVKALSDNFEGVGEPHQTEVYITPSGDYKTKDLRYGMDMLTFVRASTMPMPEMYRRSMNRLRFLRRKLIEDLQSAEKIFVHRTFADDLGLERIIELKSAMSRYGKNRLLYVRLADAVHGSGDVEQIEEDLVLGFVSAFSFEPVRELHMDGWQRVFEATAALWPIPA